MLALTESLSKSPDGGIRVIKRRALETDGPLRDEACAPTGS